MYWQPYSYTYTAFNSTSATALAIAMSHASNFTVGQTGASYTIGVSNNGQVASSGLVTVTDTLPSVLIPTDMRGSGWTCTLATLTCTRTDSLAVNGFYPIVLTVNVNSNAPPGPVTNTARLYGGGDPNPHTWNDPTTIVRRSLATLPSRPARHRSL